ncbi:MAG: NBR1-Ig-like domain-containing protein [Anaerolineales bacterium]|jgi:hypothetical protein
MPANKTILVAGACAVLLALSACQSAPATPGSVPLETQAAMTVQALLTQVSAQASDTPTLALPTETPLPPPTFAPTPTFGEVPTDTPVPFQLPVGSPTVQGTPTLVNVCNAAFFVGDVTYPDGTVVRPDFAFQKTWDVRNIGTCTWTMAYRLVFYNGKHMSGPNYVNFDQIIPPGGHIFLTVDLISPVPPGPWYGEWVLQAPDGSQFGVSTENGVFPLLVNIIVTGTLTPTPTP